MTDKIQGPIQVQLEPFLMSNAGTSNMNIYTLNKIYQLKLKTLSNLTTENTIIHSKLRKDVASNLVLEMCKFGKTEIGIHVF